MLGVLEMVGLGVVSIVEHSGGGLQVMVWRHVVIGML